MGLHLQSTSGTWAPGQRDHQPKWPSSSQSGVAMVPPQLLREKPSPRKTNVFSPPVQSSSTSGGGFPKSGFPSSAIVSASCRLCGKTFNDPLKYKAHESYHAKAQKFPCQFCGKAFHCKANRVRHERIHTGERPYRCLYCDKTFSQLSHRRSHEVTHQQK